MEPHATRVASPRVATRDPASHVSARLPQFRRTFNVRIAGHFRLIDPSMPPQMSRFWDIPASPPHAAAPRTPRPAKLSPKLLSREDRSVASNTPRTGSGTGTIAREKKKNGNRRVTDQAKPGSDGGGTGGKRGARASSAEGDADADAESAADLDDEPESEPASEPEHEPEHEPEGEAAHGSVGDERPGAYFSSWMASAMSPSFLRVLRRVTPAAKWAFVLGGATGLAWMGVSYARSSPRFALDTIHLRGGVHRTEAQLLERAEIVRGQNLFRLDPHAAEVRLQADPWIREAVVERELPTAVSITLREWTPAAVVALGAHLVLVAPDGTPFKRLAVGDPDDLPVITGLDAADYDSNTAAFLSRVRAAVHLLGEYREKDLSKDQPAQEVRLQPDGKVVLVVSKAGIELHMGRDHWRQKLAMASKIFRRLSRDARSVDVVRKVFLDGESHPERVVVRLASRKPSG